jgi:hypothetical protein
MLKYSRPPRTSSRRALFSAPSRGALGAALTLLLSTGVAVAESGGPVIDDAGSLFDEKSPPPRKFGLMFDLGTLEGGMMSLVYRPMPRLRVYGGGGTNFAAPGVRVGASVAPFENSGWAVSLDGGHFFPGNVNGLFQAFAGSDYDDSHLLERFDYNFMDLQVGWEVERGDLMFFARGGVGFLWTQLPTENLDRVRNLSTFVDPDGSFEAFLPSLKVGIIGFL